MPSSSSRNPLVRFVCSVYHMVHHKLVPFAGLHRDNKNCGCYLARNDVLEYKDHCWDGRNIGKQNKLNSLRGRVMCSNCNESWLINLRSCILFVLNCFSLGSFWWCVISFTANRTSCWANNELRSNFDAIIIFIEFSD